MVPSAPASVWVANWGKLGQTGPLGGKAGAPEPCPGSGCPAWFCLSFPITVAVSVRGLAQE